MIDQVALYTCIHPCNMCTGFCFTGEPQTFNIRVSPSPDYPLDLYFLVDLSESMRDDLETLKLLTNDIGI